VGADAVAHGECLLGAGKAALPRTPGDLSWILTCLRPYALAAKVASAQLSCVQETIAAPPLPPPEVPIPLGFQVSGLHHPTQSSMSSGAGQCLVPGSHHGHCTTCCPLGLSPVLSTYL
jgi:hypothetical protein